MLEGGGRNNITDEIMNILIDLFLIKMIKQDWQESEALEASPLSELSNLVQQDK